MDIDGIVAFKDEVQLLSWSETSNGGAKIVFQLPDGQCLDPFRDKALGKKGGQRYMCVLVEIGDDEQPVRRGPEAGPLCKLSAMWCGRVDFREWLEHHFPDTWFAAREKLSEETFGEVPSVDIAAETVRMVCDAKSRKDLDTDPLARERFNLNIRLPFGKSLHEAQPA